jgi:hypothetical protein
VYHGSNDSARRYDFITLLQLFYHLAVPLLFLPLGSNEEEIEDEPDGHELGKENHRAVAPFTGHRK